MSKIHNCLRYNEAATVFIFAGIGKVAVSNKTGFNTYYLDDLNSLKQLNYYRLKQTDQDGRFVLSSIVKISVDEVSSALRFYPNPTTDRLLIDWTGNTNTIALKITDGKGAVLESITVSAANLININISKLPNVIYWIELYDEKIPGAHHLLNNTLD